MSCHGLRSPTSGAPCHQKGDDCNCEEGALLPEAEAFHQQVCNRPLHFFGHARLALSGRSCVANMVMAVQKKQEETAYAMLRLMAYLFLLRLPSEASARYVALCCWPVLARSQALPTCKARPDSPGASSEQSIIWLEDDAVCFRMLRRKNRPKGSGVLRRICSCRGGVSTCTVHTLWGAYLGGASS